MSAKLHGRLRSHLSLWAIGAFSLAVTSFGPSVAFGQDAHALKPPAPLLKVAQANNGHANSGHGMHAASAQTKDMSIKIGDLTIQAPWARATPGGAKVAGGYLKLTNNGKESDRLVGGESAVAGHVEIHEMAVIDGIMKMRALDGGLEIKPGETIELKPGSFHVMFMNLKEPLKEGQPIKVKLTFAKAGTIEMTFDVRDISGQKSGAAHGAGSHGDSASDMGKIVHVLKATYDNAQHPLSVEPVVTGKDFAIAGWVQGGQGGRALMRKKADGTWFIMLCSGDALKSAEALHKVGVPQDEAARLAEHLAKAEAGLPAERLAKFASFEGIVMVGESGHHAPHQPPQKQDGHSGHAPPASGGHSKH